MKYTEVYTSRLHYEFLISLNVSESEYHQFIQMKYNLHFLSFYPHPTPLCDLKFSNHQNWSETVKAISLIW